MTSPPLGVASAAQVPGLTVFLMNLTDPSANAVLTPPGWRELAAIALTAEAAG